MFNNAIISTPFRFAQKEQKQNVMPQTKNILTPFLIPFAALIAALLLRPQLTHAQQADFFKNQCEEDACCLQYTDAMAAAEADWNTHVSDLLAQPKPTSDKVDQAFEGLRTYDCWLNYVCESVRVSALVDPRKLQDGIRAENLDGAIPGCQKPEDVHFGNRWAEFVAALDAQDDLIAAINEPNRIAYMPACVSNPPYNATLTDQDVQRAELYYQNCLAMAEVILGCTGDDCQSETPSAMAGLEIALKKDSASQRATALERKLFDINTRMTVMQEIVEYVKGFLTSLNQRYKCAPAKCT